ncbi:hypothetical protein [Brevifollis gellanilyticus]|uniref:Lipoprotein n=1 Tax=Brevifollis gellanilyticus TaxID=748831 RepID=A0A512ME41_9BACT|nr:hypothetical protein [Brevifollis gellanilyticus]GEP45009.1 hypothetical protein BGE01nite_43000 [Brevifollis gellanilyticus]
MTPGSRRLLTRLLALAVAVSALASCSTTKVGNGASISKVKYYHLVPSKPILVQDQAIVFERLHYLYGAVTKAEVMARAGHYYTIWWKVDDRSQPVTVRFEYRQANNGLITKVLEEEVSDIRRSNTTKFQVTGDEYSSNGRVTAWRVSLMRGKEELVTKASYLWN